MWDNVLKNIDIIIKKHKHEHKLIYNKLLEDTKKGEYVVEVGCGTAIDSAVLSNYGRSVVSVDNSEYPLRVAKEVKNKLKSDNVIIQADALYLPFKNNTFAMVFSSGVLQYFRNPNPVIMEQKRILKHKGAILIDVPYVLSFHTIIKNILKLINRWPWKIKETQYSTNKLKKLLKKHNFKIKYFYFWGVDRFLRVLLNFDEGRLGKKLPENIKKSYKLLAICFKQIFYKVMPLNIGVVCKKVI